MSVKIEFETENAAFEDDRAAETARIIHEIADRIADGWTVDIIGNIRDINGNQIGRYELTEAV